MVEDSTSGSPMPVCPQPPVYKSDAVCSSAFVVNRMYRIFRAGSRVPFVLVRHWLSVLGSSVGSKQPGIPNSYRHHEVDQVTPQRCHVRTHDILRHSMVFKLAR